MIVGIDEVGRGAWAGPLCVGAVALGDVTIEGLTDSKKLTAKKRERLNQEIKEKAAGVGLGWVSARMIDQIGLGAALKLAAARAAVQISAPFDQIIIDGTVNLLQDMHQGLPLMKVEIVTMKRADLLVPSVSAASIIAKVARDEYMKVMSQKFPGYGFEGHVGYGTAAHTAAIAALGPCPIHRMSFSPLKEIETVEPQPHIETAGEHAEAKTAEYLVGVGYQIIDRNWKTKWCEIDIIAARNGTVHFIEVKYRKNNKAGSGLAAITPKKLRQMKFAAELWLARRENQNVKQAVLSAVEVSGDEFVVTEFIEQV